MARQSGMITISTNYEVKNKAPFDARMLVPTKADLIDGSNWTWNKTYQGMLVSVAQDPETENNGLYILKDGGYTELSDGSFYYHYLNPESWVKLFSEEEFEAFQTQLTQDLENYVTQDQLNNYAKLAVGSLPETGENDTIYFVELDGNWEEYIWYNDQFVIIGSNSGDLSNYYTKEDIDNKLFELESQIPDVSNFITNTVDNLVNYYTKAETYTQTEVNNLISQLTLISFEVVSQLPPSGESNKVYLVVSSSPESQNSYDEYIWVNSNWEKIGSTDINLDNYVTTDYLNNILSQYVTQSSLTELLNTKQDTLVSGVNIKTINGYSILGEGNIQIQGGSGGDISIATEDTVGGILATDNSLVEGVEAFVGVDDTGKASVKIPSVDETSTPDDVINLLNTSTLILNGNA